MVPCSWFTQKELGVVEEEVTASYLLSCTLEPYRGLLSSVSVMELMQILSRSKALEGVSEKCLAFRHCCIVVLAAWIGLGRRILWALQPGLSVLSPL